jgi:TRAP-type C4-dicarboxylate transport system permease small subunit
MPMLRQVWSFIEAAAFALLIGLFALMIAACTAQVISRYLFASPLIWSEELARYLFIWIGFLSSWLAWKHRAHIALDAVTMLFGPRVVAVSRRIVEAVILAFCLYTLPSSLTIMGLTHAQPSAVLELPMSYVYASYTVMVVMIALDIVIGWVSPAPAAPRHVEA